MRIALVARELYPYVGGGIAPIVTAAARTLSEIADVTVVTSADHRKLHEELRAQADPRLVPDDVTVLFVEEPGEDGWGAAYTYMHAYSARVHRVLKEHYGNRGPDIIEFPDYLAEGFVTIQDRHTNAPWLRDTTVCVRLHTTSEMCSVLDGRVPDDFPTNALFEAERYALRHADRLLWSGGDVLSTYQRFYGPDALAPAVLIRDAFLDEFPSAAAAPDERTPLAGTGRPVELLYLGRMERRKGVQNLVRALVSLGRRDWHLTLLGGDTLSGPTGVSVRDQLELMVADDDRFTFADPVPRHDVPAFLRQHDVVVIPSLWECWPNVGREALMAGRPLLATPVGGLLDMAIPGRSGWRARQTTPDAIREAIEAMLDDRAGIDELIQSGGPAQVASELTSREELLSRYTALCAHTEVASAPRNPKTGTSRRVSVVIPYFRLAQHVEETVASVLAQTYDDLEILIVNDGSVLDEDDVIFSLADRGLLRVLTQPNAGLSAARNFGISQSTGALILPLDADDMLEPNFIERCVLALDGDPDLAYATTWAQFVDEDGKPFGDDLGGYLPYGNWSSMIEENNVGGTCSSVFRRRVFERGFRYSPDLTSYEDWLLYWTLHEAGLHGAVIPERLFRYRVRRTSMIRKDGAPLTSVIFEELRAHVREQAMQWSATAS